jgi:FkbM family methyltransferase
MITLRKKIKKWLYGSCPGFAGSFPYFKTKTFFPRNSLIFDMACEQGIYEADNVRLISSLIEEDTVYFDIGANIGLMSLPVLYYKKRVKVVSIEASPNALPYLQKTVLNSTYKDRWIIIGKAAGERIGSSDFFIHGLESGAYDGYNDTGRAGETKKITVDMTTVDHEWENLKCPNVSLVKIDVEGAEYKVIHGADYCIKACRPYIFIEWNDENLKAYECNPNTIIDFSEKCNYDIYAMPNLMRVFSNTELKLQMIITENFLLAPR